jgi:hypothetical protein
MNIRPKMAVRLRLDPVSSWKLTTQTNGHKQAGCYEHLQKVNKLILSPGIVLIGDRWVQNKTKLEPIP